MPGPASPRRDWRWSAIGIGAMVVLWEVGHLVYGSLVLPSPAETVAALAGLIAAGSLLPAVAATMRDAVSGFTVAALVGLAAGALAGANRPLRHMLKPIATTLLGVPSIAWVVLALLWFGGSGLATVFTVAVTTAPIVYGATVAAVASLDGSLRTMARSFRVPPLILVADLYLPHMLSYVFPALVTTLAMSWKIAVMAELLSGAGGIGDRLASARAVVDTAAAFAWIIVVVALLLVAEAAVLDPLRRFFDAWRRELPGGGR